MRIRSPLPLGSKGTQARPLAHLARFLSGMMSTVFLRLVTSIPASVIPQRQWLTMKYIDVFARELKKMEQQQLEVEAEAVLVMGMRVLDVWPPSMIVILSQSNKGVLCSVVMQYQVELSLGRGLARAKKDTIYWAD
jgi:hypothetical protein